MLVCLGTLRLPPTEGEHNTPYDCYGGYVRGWLGTWMAGWYVRWMAGYVRWVRGWLVRRTCVEGLVGVLGRESNRNA